MDSNNMMMGQVPGEGPHSGHILRRATSQDIRAFRWLSPTFLDMEEIFDDLVDQICPGTCEWIESSEKFGRWVHAQGAAVLGITGRIGCGKSVLAAKIVQLLKSSPQGEGNRPPPTTRDYSIYSFYNQQLGPYYWEDLYNVPQPIAYVFCHAIPAEERKVSSVLPILLAQLCRQNSSLLEAVSRRMELSQNASASWSDLIRIFEEDVSRAIPTFYIVLDGAEQVRDLLRFFFQFLPTAQNAPRVLFLARDTYETPDRCPLIDMSLGNEVQEDRKSIISFLLDGLITEQYHQRIASYLTQAEPSSVLGPIVAASLLEDCVIRSDFETSVANFPTDIEGLYAFAFRRHTGEPDQFKREVAVRCLSLIAVAQRPLDICELQTALSIPEDGTDFEFDSRLSDLGALLHATCPALITISRKSITGGIYSVFLTTVSLVHPSLSDFMFSHSRAAAEFGLPLSRPLLHTAVGRLCLVYLSLSHFSAADQAHKSHRFQRGARHDTYPHDGLGFLSYAGVYVFEHLSKSGQTGQLDGPLLQDLQRFFNAHSNVQNWSRFVSSCSPAAKFISRGEKVDLSADVWLPGFGERLTVWAEGFRQTKNADFEKILMGWRQEFLKGEVLDGSHV